MSELKPLPCPFCGGKTLKIVNDNWIKCENIHCGARGPMQDDNPVRSWNRRASPWISVEDRLPEDGQSIFVVDKDIEEPDAITFWEGETRQSFTHWMAIPDIDTNSQT